MSFVREQDAMTAIASKSLGSSDFLSSVTTFRSRNCLPFGSQRVAQRKPASAGHETTPPGFPWKGSPGRVPLEGFPWKGSAPRVLLGFPGKQYQYKSGFARTPSCAAMSLTIFGVIWHLSRISQCYGWYGSDWLI